MIYSFSRFSLQLFKLKKSTLDVVTRWNSTFEILKGLLCYQQFCDDNLGPFSLPEEDWNRIINIVKVLRPVHATTMELQRSQLLLGDFYKLWLNIKLQMKLNRIDIANTLMKCVQARESQILQNDPLCAAIYLDPRLKRLLKTEEKAQAIKHLKALATRMILLNQVSIEHELNFGSSLAILAEISFMIFV